MARPKVRRRVQLSSLAIVQVLTWAQFAGSGYSASFTLGWCSRRNQSPHASANSASSCASVIESAPPKQPNDQPALQHVSGVIGSAAAIITSPTCVQATVDPIFACKGPMYDRQSDAPVRITAGRRELHAPQAVPAVQTHAACALHRGGAGLIGGDRVFK